MVNWIELSAMINCETRVAQEANEAMERLTNMREENRQNLKFWSDEDLKDAEAEMWEWTRRSSVIHRALHDAYKELDILDQTIDK